MRNHITERGASVVENKNKERRKMIIIERQQFINWTNGILLDFKRGVGVVVNERMCQKAYNSAKKVKK